MIEVALCCH